MSYGEQEDSGISLLYVDDEPVLLNMSKLFLEKTGGFSVTTAGNAKDALKLLSEKPFDAVVSDYQMSGMDGIGLLKSLRSAGNRIPFIIFTGKSREEVVIEALNEGADFYLQKGGDPKSQYAELAHKIKSAVKSKRAEEALEKRVIMLTQPPAEGNIEFEDLFDIDEIQRIQDDFSTGAGVASIITRPDGTPITKPSNFTRLCRDVIRKSEYGCKNCFISNATIGKPNPDGPTVQKCLSGGLWDAGASIIVNGRHIANWLAGQVRNEAQTEEKMLEYARKIGADENVFLDAYYEVPSMSTERFENVSKALFAMANQLSKSTYHNLRQARSIAEYERTKKELLQKTEELNAAYEQLAASEEELRQNYDELVKSEKELRESETKFKTLVDLSLDGILVVDFSGKILFANMETSRILDVKDSKSLAGRANIMDYIAPESRAGLEKDLGCVLQGIDRYPVGYKIINKAGREIWIECIGKKIHFNDSEAMLVFIWDVTGQKEIEEQLKESENKFTTVFMNSPFVLTLISGTDQKFTDVNEKFVSQTGYSVEETIGKTPEELGIFQDNNQYKLLLAAMREKGSIDNYEINCRKKSGEINLCSFTSRYILMGGKPFCLAVVEDITERKTAEEAVRFANRKLNILSDITRHDILNQLMVIKGFLEIAEDHILDQPGADCLNYIKKASSAIQRHIEFTREYENLGVNKPVWIDIRELISDSGNEKVVLYNDCRNIEVNADPMLEKVFLNLMDNTIRHGEATEVRVGCEISGDLLKILWEDNGTGIPDSDKERIFEKGFGKTTGFGLFLSREILSITGISICETGEEGVGARFEITVPGEHFKVVSN
ncbi:PocR ligand-binding domain-containing protein [Methanolacinia paynteri]|uniref:PocR ligand-binding domain-containing protein n=1 Tax=Methanolacinia paynteri TaxID=230356 RepID=UPI000693B57A|nr:PocR ligand-binding domain-containing protein [Methanolacinia paynteri]